MESLQFVVFVISFLYFMLSSLIHIVTFINTLFFFIAEHKPTLQIYRILFIHPSPDEYLNSFHFWAIMNYAPLNIHLQFSLGMYFHFGRVFKALSIVKQSSVSFLFYYNSCWLYHYYKFLSSFLTESFFGIVYVAGLLTICYKSRGFFKLRNSQL
jgi:hypothetical protein